MYGKMRVLLSIVSITLLLSISTTSAETMRGYVLFCTSETHLEAALNFLESGVTLEDALYATNETVGIPETCVFQDIFFERMTEGFDADHLGIHGKIAEVRIYAYRDGYRQVIPNPSLKRYSFFAADTI